MFIFHNASKHLPVCFRAATVHCSFPNCHHFSEQRKCVALNRKSRSGIGTHLSEQRRFSSAHGRRAAHVPKLWYHHFRLLTSSAFVVVPAFRLICVVTQQAEKRRWRRKHVITSCASSQRFISYAPASQQAEKRHCRRKPYDHLIRIQFVPSVLACKKSSFSRQLDHMSCNPGRRVFL